MPLTPEAAFTNALATVSGPEARVGVAVSGGGDSMALLVLAIDWGRRTRTQIFAATVDHGLRPASADEAQVVATFCAALDIPHQTLVWKDWDRKGNVQAKARDARRGLLRDWAQHLGLTTVILGHTADDQAETVLMRLARGSGVDGLAGMAARPDALFLRPLLRVTRADLRTLLTDRGIAWQDDPSNDDLHFDRVKARQMLPVLAELGLSADRLIQTAAHMERASASLWQAAAAFARTHSRSEAGDLVFDSAILAEPWGDTEPRCLAAALRWMGGRDYRPRFTALSDAVQAVRRAEQRTLNGVIWIPEAGGLRLSRELSKTQAPVCVSGETTMWDKRWEITAPDGYAVGPDTRIGALGDHITDCPDWRSVGLPRACLMATPGIFEQGGLIAAPIAGFRAGWTARIVADFPCFLLSH